MKVGVGWGCLLGGDVGPALGVFAIELQPLISAFVGIGLDGVNRALGFAYPAVNALVWMDDEHIFAFIEAIDGTDFHAIGVFALDAVFVDDVSHACVRLAHSLRPAGYAGQGYTRTRAN